MPAIWNVNNSYNVNNSNKKVASKLAFNVGEKFSGNVIKKGDGKEVSIKLTDGWEFSAEVDGDLDSLEKGFQRFEVEGFEDGKLKLKIVNKETGTNQGNKGELNDIITKEGLSKKDIPILEAMLKYDIPLTRENIKMVKGLIQVNEKIQGNPKEIQKFISKYLESRGIDPSSTKGQAVTQKLQQFLDVFKNLSKEEVLLFLENNIEFTKENIDSYNKLFKGQGKVSNIINEIKSEFKNLNLLENIDISESESLNLGKNMGNSEDVKQNKDINNKFNNVNIQNGEESRAQVAKETIPVSIEGKVTVEEKNGTKVENKNQSNPENKNEFKLEEKSIQALEPKSGTIQNDSSKSDNSNNKLLTGTYEKNDAVQNKVSVLAVLKSLMGGGEELLNIELKDLINNRSSDFTTKGFEKAYNAINKIDDASFISMLKNEIGEYNNSPQKTENNLNDYINKKMDDAKFGGGELSFNKIELESVLSKVIGKDIVVTKEEFTKIKDIVNLKITEGENSNKTITVEQPKNEVVIKDGSLVKGEKINESLNGKNIVNESQNDKNTINLKIDNTEILKGLIKDKISSQEEVRNNILLKAEEGKEIIKSILSSIKNEGEVPGKILDIIKNNISDIKLFNKINQEYYYLDVPVNIKEQEYPCRLILKDNRKDGKKIDSTNVKMVVTVKTVNLGVVDGYIKVLEKKIDIDLKCEDSFVKILDLGKEKLVSNIKTLGFNISVKVSKKEDEVSLTNCREFFNENNMANIDIKV
ncbi:hypothetical protein [Clostridium gasigenes]|uniref:hypothetical protein n=1 Tax=Clostridium gasigenes TaxID=94869 RepID=UPI001C0DF6FB|nr:hypothetical protein [Clostridium gasigenes]MBU3108847.1 hypothetical protein [Clostridium gasigenes]